MSQLIGFAFDSLLQTDNIQIMNFFLQCLTFHYYTSSRSAALRGTFDLSTANEFFFLHNSIFIMFKLWKNSPISFL